MHLTLILLAISVACGVRLFSRCIWFAAEERSCQWQHSLWLFLLPPALLFTTLLAVLKMGTEGQMLGLPVGWIGYSTALLCLGFASSTLLWATGQAWYSLRRIQSYPQLQLQDEQGELVRGHLLDTETPFAAQIGFWCPQLVLSRGLIALLSADQLAAVLSHEQAHQHYRDTFWFFWLGWLRQISAWLPHTEALWQELLLLRELRADQWAAQRVDGLLLAESLVLVVQTPMQDPIAAGVALGDSSIDRLEMRVEALLSGTTPDNLSRSSSSPLWLGWGVGIACLPFITMLFHS